MPDATNKPDQLIDPIGPPTNNRTREIQAMLSDRQTFIKSPYLRLMALRQPVPAVNLANLAPLQRREHHTAKSQEPANDGPDYVPAHLSPRLGGGSCHPVINMINATTADQISAEIQPLGAP